jgi:hypothetical protein
LLRDGKPILVVISQMKHRISLLIYGRICFRASAQNPDTIIQVVNGTAKMLPS